MTEHSPSCCVLGSVRVGVDAREVKVAAPRQRALLAMLLLDANRTVSAAALIDGIWGEAPPQHPESALHIVVCRLRQVLDSVAHMLVRDPAGYRIGIAPEALDLTRAIAHAVAARRFLDVADAKHAASEFDAALAWWSGEPLADVATFPFYERAAPRLRELQVGTVESRNAGKPVSKPTTRMFVTAPAPCLRAPRWTKPHWPGSIHRAPRWRPAPAARADPKPAPGRG